MKVGRQSVLRCPVINEQQFEKTLLADFMCLRGKHVLAFTLVGCGELASGWNLAGDQMEKGNCSQHSVMLVARLVLCKQSI